MEKSKNTHLIRLSSTSLRFISSWTWTPSTQILRTSSLKTSIAIEKLWVRNLNRRLTLNEHHEIFSYDWISISTLQTPYKVFKNILFLEFRFSEQGTSAAILPNFELIEFIFISYTKYGIKLNTDIWNKILVVSVADCRI